MFKKLFGRKKLPREDGNSELKVDHNRWVKKFQLILSNMEDTPSYELTHQLTVGREVGNIVVNDPSISPRHATFTLQEGVVSVIDHGSSTGTLVNGKKIPVGKFIILQESDFILIGDLEIKLTASNEALSEEDIPPPPEIKPIIAQEKKKVVFPDEPKPSVATRAAPPVRPKGKASAKKKAKFGMKSFLAANSLMRVLAILGDFALAYILVVLLYPFDEFREIHNLIPQMLADIFQINWSQLWSEAKASYPGPVAMLEDVAGFLLSFFDFLPLLFTYGMIRIFSTLLFGVSISQFMFGMRAGMNGIWARIGGFLRVLIGFFTWPFIIFDLPALVSRRTFKEVITHTHLFTGSKILAFMGTIIYPPILLVLALLAPLFQGLELPEPVLINAKIDQRVKLAEPAPEATPPAAATTPSEDAPEPADGSATAPDAAVATTPGTEEPVPAEAAPVQKTSVTTASDYLDLKLTYSPEDFSVLPVFKFLGVSNKTKLQAGVALVTKGELEAAAELELLKSFDMKQLLGIAIKGNPLLFNRYPHIHDFVYSPEQGSSALQVKPSPETDEAFVKEFIDLMQISFGLSLNNFVEVMQTKTPLLNGLIDFKSSFLALLGDKNFVNQDFIKMGNTVFLRLTYNTPKPHDLLMPIQRSQGRLYKLTLDQDNKKEEGAVRNRIYKYALDETDWSPGKVSSSGDIMTPLEVIDTFTIDYQQDKLTLEKAQSLYGYYYEKSAEILKNGFALEYQKWNSSLGDVIEILQTLKSRPVEEGAEDPKSKLLHNFRDLKSAFENRNLEFFGIGPTVVLGE